MPERVLFILNGGIGDACMAAPAIRRLCTQEWGKADTEKDSTKVGRRWEVTYWPMSSGPRMVARLMTDWPLEILEGKQPGREFETAMCGTTSEALKQRTDWCKVGRLINPKSWGGTPGDWALDMIQQIGALRNPLPPVFADKLPHPRKPEALVFGPAVGPREKNQEKRWVGFDALVAALPDRTIELVGAPDALCVEAIRNAPNVVNWIGRTPDILGVLPIFARAALYVGVDNGLGHLAAACGVPTLTIFGATSASRFKPQGHLATTVGDAGMFPTVADVLHAIEGLVGEPVPC